MHILIIPSWYPKSSSDVSGCFFREQAQALARHANRVGVIFPQKKPVRNIKKLFNHQYGLEKVNDLGVSTFRYHYLARLPLAHRVNTWLWVYFGLLLFRKYIEVNGRPDVIHAHSLLDGGVLASKISEYYQIPFIVTEHKSNFYTGNIRKWQHELSIEIINKASVCMAVSEHFSQTLNNIFKNANKKWMFVPNMLSSYFQESVNTALLTDKSSEFLFCNISLLTKNKGVDILLRAFSQSFSGQGNIRLAIAGDGEERKYLEKLSVDLNINSQVEFLGMLSRKQVRDLLLRSQVYVLSSYIETFGMALIESLALGKPVVATRCGGPESIVRGKDGILIPVNNVNEMAVAMKQIHDDYKRYDRLEIQSSCVKRFGEETVIKQLSKIYQDVILDAEQKN